MRLVLHFRTSIKLCRLWTLDALPPVKNRLPSFDKGLNAFFGVFALQNPVANERQNVDGGFLSRFDELAAGLFRHLNAERCVLSDQLRELHSSLTLLPGGNDLL